MLYTPPGAITFHRVLNGSDVLGVKVGFMSTGQHHIISRLVHSAQRLGVPENVPLKDALQLQKLKAEALERPADAIGDEEDGSGSRDTPKANSVQAGTETPRANGVQDGTATPLGDEGKEA